MKGCLHVVRDNREVLTISGPRVEVRSNGTLWINNVPILGIIDPEEKKKYVEIIKAKKYADVPAIYYTSIGDNANGLWAGDDTAWASHPAKIEMEKLAADNAREQAKQVKIHLSSRGCGDYSSVVWHGDITRPDADILAECKSALANQIDVDHPNQSDDDLLAMIRKARNAWGNPAPVKPKPQHGHGYCYICETYCYGDCGDYRSTRNIGAGLSEAAREQNYGIQEEA